MEKNVDMKSPFTGGRVKEVSTTEVKEFRKEKFKVHVRYYVCEDTGEQFTTTEQDTLLFNDLYAQYRVKHGIPFPDEIKEIRTGYGLNYTQISRILGFGVNQYAKYESGEVPSESNGKMIAAIKNRDVLLDILQNCRSEFQPSEYERIVTSILKRGEEEDSDVALQKIIFTDNARNIFNGYGHKDISKLLDLVKYIVARHGEVFPTKLNKLMFYCDFCHYRKFGQSISALRYKALDFGPVPDRYATIYDNVPGLYKRFIEAHNMVSALLSCESSAGERLSASEIKTVDEVVDKLRDLSVSEIIEASHKENGWKLYFQSRSHIPYDEAFDLKLV